MTYNYDDKLKDMMEPKPGSDAPFDGDKRKGIVQPMQGKRPRTKGPKRGHGHGPRARSVGDGADDDGGGDAPTANRFSELGSDVRIAEILDVHRGTVWRLTREDPSFPRPIRLSRGSTRWRISEVLAWIEARAKASA